MTLPAHTRVSLADEAYSRLKQDLADFVWAPGDRFTEQAVCERLQVSRTPVRQALVRLQQEGHVEVLFRNGWRVLPIDFQRFDQLYDLRLLLETEAVQRLCEGRLFGEPQRAEKILADLVKRWIVPKAKRSNDSAQVCMWDEEFHSALVDATGNAEMLRVHQDITDRIRIIRRLDFIQASRIEATYDEHEKILQSIRKQRPEQTRILLKAHVEASRLEVRKITVHQIHLVRERTRNTTG
ncbi:MAG: hypothetical protein RIR70_2108 [Pseudomonadota bacterium]|jgi:DNA-binding GntR family transcriptional regulator